MFQNIKRWWRNETRHTTSKWDRFAFFLFVIVVGVLGAILTGLLVFIVVGTVIVFPWTLVVPMVIYLLFQWLEGDL